MTTAEKEALLKERLTALGLPADGNATGKLVAYQEMLADWNTRMNLTGDASFSALLDRHLVDSLTSLSVEGLLPVGATVVDVGSGAGFPGIPLAVIRPDLKLTLLDSLGKRITFLNAVIEALALPNVLAAHDRAEDAGRNAQYRERFDAAIARAVAPLNVLWELLLPLVRVGGHGIAYKGPSVEEELAAGNGAAQTLGGGIAAVIPVSSVFLPEHRHCLAVSEKIRHTPNVFPRKAGMPAKNPLGT